MSSMHFKILVVDDDLLIHQSFKMLLPSGWALYSATSSEEIPEQPHFHVAFVDMHLQVSATKAEGLEILNQLKKKLVNTPLVAMSGDLQQSLMEKALLAGAERFIAKPLLSEEIHSILQKTESQWLLLQHMSQKQNAFQLVGQSPSLKNLIKKIAITKNENGPFLIEGESGTGKEVVAHLIHQTEGSLRPFIPVNVAALPENLFESELFGHVKGAFTGADRDKAGLIELAHGGDLFLDEIEALAMPLQAKLLRFLESGEIRRVGARDHIHVKVRIIAASNQSLQKLVQDQLFREDLLFRLKADHFLLPPLKERIEDLPHLCEYFVDKQKPRRNKKFTEDAIVELSTFPWPGNVRELKRVVEQLCIQSPLPLIRAEDVKNLLKVTSQELRSPQNSDLGLDTLVSAFEKQVIQETLQKCNQDVEKAAGLLKVSKSNLYKKIKDYTLELKS